MSRARPLPHRRDMPSVQVDPGFRSAMPALAPEERQALMESLREHGCRDALVAWDSPVGPVLLDGHNRLALCQELGIAYQIVLLDFPGREAAIDWIDRNQLARRNLTPAQRALLRGRLYNRRKQPHGGARVASPQVEGLKTAQRVGREEGVSRATVERDGRFAAALETLRALDPGLEGRILAGVESPQRSAVVEAAALAVHDPAGAWRRLKGTMTSTSYEWTSPRVVIDATLQLMGEIDLDPCSPLEGPSVPARRHYTLADDGLSLPWERRVYLNPPYGRTIALWTRKLMSEVRAGRVTEAVVLAPCRTDAKWMHELRQWPRCFLRGRLAFSGRDDAAPFASVVVYCGKRLERFREAFAALGDVYVLYQGPPDG